MAGVYVENRNGKTYYRLQFYDKDGHRRSIRLGRISRKDAETVCARVEHLVSSSISGAAVSAETARWLATRGDDLIEKLAKVGLTEPRAPAALEPFVERFVSGRSDAKPNTVKNWNAAKRSLVAFFGSQRNMRDIKPGECDDWRQSLVNAGKAPATIAVLVKKAKQFFRAAERAKLFEKSPMGELKAGSDKNRTRLQFVSRAVIDKVLIAAPDAEWRAIIALARYGGLRTPSETLTLRWAQIDWQQNQISVPSPKTQRNGKSFRRLPLFPELRQYLEEARRAASQDAVHVVNRYRDHERGNLRTQLLRILERAEVKPWPRLFHNLRASRQTELTDLFPAHVVAEWMGNTVEIADNHYLQTLEHHFAKATEIGGATGGAIVVQKPVLQATEPKRTRNEKTPAPAGVTSLQAFPCSVVQTSLILPTGVEPVLPD